MHSTKDATQKWHHTKAAAQQWSNNYRQRSPEHLYRFRCWGEAPPWSFASWRQRGFCLGEVFCLDFEMSKWTSLLLAFRLNYTSGEVLRKYKVFLMDVLGESKTTAKIFYKFWITQCHQTLAPLASRFVEEAGVLWFTISLGAAVQVVIDERCQVPHKNHWPWGVCISSTLKDSCRIW